MQKDYRGYLVMFGSHQLPNSFLTRYASIPDQRIEKKPGGITRRLFNVLPLQIIKQH